MTSIDARLLGLPDVSRETLDRLENLLELTAKWNPAINLVSKSTLPDGWDRHIRDSAQLFNLAPTEARNWVDLGSGGGYPGLVIAVLSKELTPERRVTLVESDQRKATFLRQAAQSLGLSVRVIVERAELVEPLNADVLSARALASLTKLCEFAQRHLAPAGIALFPKGAAHAEELALARQSWVFDLAQYPSLTDKTAAILVLSGVSHV